MRVNCIFATQLIGFGGSEWSRIDAGARISSDGHERYSFPGKWPRKFRRSQRLERSAVTGSRIRHDTYGSANGRRVVPEQRRRSRARERRDAPDTTVASARRRSRHDSSAFVQAGGVGTETLSLRGLGPNRTLVLLNGRRAGPAGVRGEVSSFDFNVLPLSVIERVEILKDGASSIYGSDAVAGVVNVITRKDDGATADAFIGIPNQSGGEESRFNFSFGKNLDRGKFPSRRISPRRMSWRAATALLKCGSKSIRGGHGRQGRFSRSPHGTDSDDLPGVRGI